MKTYLTPNEIKQMIALAPTLRDKVLISFLADTGCRISELLSIKIEHLDFENNLVLIPHLKRGIRKKCPKCLKPAGRSQPFCSHCGTDLSKVIAEGLQERSRLINVGSGTMQLIRQYLKGRPTIKELLPLTRQHAYLIIRQAGEAAGIGKILNPTTGEEHYVHPHIFRASLAVDWLHEAGDDVGMQKALQDHLGHQRFETTMGYNKLAPGDVRKTGKKVMEKRFGTRT